MKSKQTQTKRRRRRQPVSRNTFVIVNGLAALAMAVAALRVPGWLTIFYPSVLTWVPVGAFCGAALAGLQASPARALLAMILNAAAVLVFCGFTLVAFSDVDVARVGLPFALPGIALAAWNLYRLSAAAP